MLAPKTIEIKVSEQQKAILEEISKSRTKAARLVERAKIILLGSEQVSGKEISEKIELSRSQVWVWRKRWSEVQGELEKQEQEGLSVKEESKRIEGILDDRARAGGPAKFEVETILKILLVAQEEPEESGRPVSHWTPRELRQEVLKRSFFKNEGSLKPSRYQRWLNPDVENLGELNAQVKAVCKLYEEAPQLHSQGTHVISTDEMTGIQALERVIRPMEMGHPQKIDHEYVRHGPVTLIANWEVATGKVISPSLGATRTEADFANHIANTVALAPNDSWIFISDNLNTHQSATLVEWVAEVCHLDDPLGVKGKSGILATQPSRALFLSDKSHRIHFVYTPKHCSWLNQVECWFSILARRLLRRSSFLSVEHLSQKIIAFINYFNELLSKPFKWKFRG